jgi:Zn-dependent protease with chaperone function
MIFVPLAFLTAMVMAWGFNAIELVPWRRDRDAHWTERARRLYPVRVSRQINLLWIPISLSLLAHQWVPEFPWQVVALAGILGAVLGNFPMDRAIEPGLKFPVWIEQRACDCFLIFPVWIVVLVTVALMPPRFGWPVWAIAGVFLAVHFALQYGLGFRLMRQIGLLRPASPRLQSLVDETSARLGIPVSRTWEVRWGHANALAIVTIRELVFAEKILAVCPDNEIKAICAHELGHVSESRTVLGGRLAGTLQVLPLIFIRPVHAVYPLGVAFLFLAFVGILLLSLRLSRAMEKRADQVAAESIEEATVHARALERLYQASQMPAVQSKESSHTHPDLYDRMVAAGLKPDYPRPAAPAKQGWTSQFMLVACLMFYLFL